MEDVVAVVWENLLANNLTIVRQCLRHGYFLQTIHVLARNRTIDMLRKRRPATVPLEGHEPAGEPTPDVLPTAAADTTDAKLQKALAILTSREYALVDLFFLQGKKYKEIAILTGISINSIGPTIGRALVKLRQVLQG